jgi:hypothetical protein
MMVMVVLLLRAVLAVMLALLLLAPPLALLPALHLRHTEAPGNWGGGGGGGSGCCAEWGVAATQPPHGRLGRSGLAVTVTYPGQLSDSATVTSSRNAWVVLVIRRS